MKKKKTNIIDVFYHCTCSWIFVLFWKLIYILTFPSPSCLRSEWVFSCAACAGYTQTELHCFHPSANFSPVRGTKRYSLRSYPGNCIQVTVGVARLLGFLMISLQSVGCVLHRRRTAAAPSLPPTRLTLGPHHHNHQHHHQEHQHQTHHHNHQHHHQEHQHQTHNHNH